MNVYNIKKSSVIVHGEDDDKPLVKIRIYIDVTKVDLRILVRYITFTR